MKPGFPLRMAAVLLGALLLSQTVPVRAQTPGPPPRAAPPALPEILEFDRKLCPVCKEAEGIIREVKDRHPGQFAVRRLYIDEHGPMFRRYRVAIVPTQVFLDASRQEVFRHEGVFPTDKLIQKLRELKFIQNGEK
jgi:thioredoxin 1